MKHRSAPAMDGRVPRRRLNARVRNFRDRTMVAGSNEPLELSESATFLWRLIDGRRSVGDLADALCAEYDVDRDTAVTDVAELIDTLHSAGVVDC
jgi:hypothetical protein